MDYILESLSDTPLVGFTVLLLVILTVPPVFEQLRLPGLVGLLVAGVVLGPDGLGFLDPGSEAMKLLSDIGKIYLMFVAGLEIDLMEFHKTRNRSLGFGLATFLVPLIFGTVVGQGFGFGLNASILIGSLLASHTLLGYPIVNRLGVTGNEAVTVTVGATIFTDTAALLVLAICISIHAGEFSATSLIIQLGALAIYAVVVLYGFAQAGKVYFRRTGNDEGNQFLFVLLAVFLASVGAQVINIDQIVGAFMAGLAVNGVVGRGPVQEKVIFVGSTLFIPFFFVGMGLLLSVSSFIETLTTGFWLTVAIVGALISSKFLAAWVAKLLYRYNWHETLSMWSLSLPQVAATLAATLAGVNAGLLTSDIFNAVIVLMLVTSVLGPIITSRAARHLTIPKTTIEVEEEVWGLRTDDSIGPPSEETQSALPFTVVVPVHNPHTERYLIEAGALLARHEAGVLIPLSIAKSHIHMDDPELENELQKSRRLLQKASTVSQELRTKAKPIVRIDDDIAHGICRAAREYHANLIVMGWAEMTGFRARLFGNVIDSVFWSTHCPVAVMRLLDEPMQIRRILVPVKNLTAQALRPVGFAQLLADTNQASITLLHVCDRQTTKDQILEFESELTTVLAATPFHVDITIQTTPEDNVAQGILKAARNHDLVILRSLRRRTAGGLAVSDVTTEVLSKVSGSVVLFGEPHHLA
ncbi:cation:proton antiporter domain-containing protein [Egbenema bharatensis]|uniref:cation:proton antiporter domain-containing protein n=1 Tax=Egbenema bharatensis TaxID=3463334 RepID=UPI003A872405